MMKLKRKISSLLLAICLAAGLMPITALAAGADTGKAIQLGTGGISDPTAMTISSGTYKEPSDYVYFGVNSSVPIKWRVLDADKANDGVTSGMFLLSEYLLGSNVYFQEDIHRDMDSGDYHKGENPGWDHSKCVIANSYQGSDAQAWCKDFFGNSSTFSATEQDAFLGVAKNDAKEEGLYKPDKKWGESSITVDDRLFFLSARELADYVGNYNVAPGLKAYENAEAEAAQKAARWWLRSPDAEDGYTGTAGEVSVHGYPTGTSVDYPIYARPAFNLNLNSVFFTSAADNSGHSGSFSAPADYSGNEWKLTLKDSNDFSAGASLASGSTALAVGYSDATLTIAHNTLDSIGAGYTNVTAMLTDADGKILYYGSINNVTSATSSSVTIPAGLAEGSYTLSVYGEDWNGEKQTDYATGTPFTMQISVTAAAPAITTDSLPGGIVGTPYSGRLEADGSTPMTWSIESGSLPDGLSLSGDTINGTPTVSGTFTFTVKAENSVGSDTKELSVTIADASHTHDWTGAWGSDDTYHWRECANPGCGETDNSKKGSYGEHIYADGVCDCGKLETEEPGGGEEGGDPENPGGEEGGDPENPGEEEGGDIPENPGESEATKPQAPHTHQYAWKLVREADAEQDGEEIYVCDGCGSILARQSISAFGVYCKEVLQQIEAAETGDVVEIVTDRWTSYPRYVLEALERRPDITLVTDFRYQGQDYRFVILAETAALTENAAEAAVSAESAAVTGTPAENATAETSAGTENGGTYRKNKLTEEGVQWYGYLYLGGKYGLEEIQEEK